MDIALKGGRYKSIDSLDWRDIPPLAVITGPNGSGKTQLLEMIAIGVGVVGISHPTGRSMDQLPHGTRPNLECSQSLNAQNTLFLRSYWPAAAHGSSHTALYQAIDSVRLARSRQVGQPETEWERLWEYLEKAVGQPRAAITDAQLEEHLPPNFPVMSTRGPVGLNIGLLFVSYLNEIVARCQKEQIPIERAKTLLAPLPWDSINEAFALAGLSYRVQEPELPAFTKLGPQQISASLVLKDLDRGIVVSPDDLSAGELVLLQVAIWSFTFSQALSEKRHRLLLLDEPDAHLHPAMAWAFMKVIKTQLVEKYGVNVIMTTHSPTTVALAEDENIFLMTREEPRVRPARSKWEAVGQLTAGLVTVGSQTKSVFVEYVDDASFYRAVQQLLMQPHLKALDPLRSMNFVPAALGKEPGGRESVMKWVSLLEGTHVVGIIDLDDGNKGAERVHVLKRRAIESYLLDPLYLFALLVDEGLKYPALTGHTFSDGDRRSLLSLPAHTLQAMADAMCKVYADAMGKSDGGERQPVSYFRGPTLDLPSWVLKEDLKKLFHPLQNRFAFPALENGLLIRKYPLIGIVPTSLVECLQAVQAG